jgi:hypothetical protein
MKIYNVYDIHLLIQLCIHLIETPMTDTYDDLLKIDDEKRNDDLFSMAFQPGTERQVDFDALKSFLPHNQLIAVGVAQSGTWVVYREGVGIFGQNRIYYFPNESVHNYQLTPSVFWKNINLYQTGNHPVDKDLFYNAMGNLWTRTWLSRFIGRE